jgi:hypothetical protein
MVKSAKNIQIKITDIERTILAKTALAVYFVPVAMP